MPLDATSMSSALVADLAREFPWATQQQLVQVVEGSMTGFADARVLSFLPVLARREARRALQAMAPASAATVVQQTRPLIDLDAASKGVVSRG